MTTLPPPEGGADPHRDDWVPVPLLAKKYDPETKVYFIEFEAPKQLLLNPQYSAMVHDELLRNADRDGLIIEGQIVITETDKTSSAPAEQKSLVEGEKMMPEVEQDQIETPYKMSEAEIAYRKRMRTDLQQTGMEALGFTQAQLDGKPLPGGREFKVNPEAFLEGFHGAPPAPPRREVMVVHAEALVAMSLGAISEEDQQKFGPPNQDIDIDRVMLDIEIPDDLSGLDG